MKCVGTQLAGRVIYMAWPQIFGKDSFLTLGQETVSSREQWAASVDDPVSLAAPAGLPSVENCRK